MYTGSKTKPKLGQYKTVDLGQDPDIKMHYLLGILEVECRGLHVGELLTHVLASVWSALLPPFLPYLA
jgi:hypothetical protein